MNKEKVVVVISFIFLLAICIGAIELVRSLTIMTDKTYQNNTYQFYSQGASDVVGGILSMAIKCEAVPLQYQNQTYNLVWTECLDLINTGGKQ